MKNVSEDEKRIAQILEQMRKALPEIKRQIAVYEKSKAAGTLNKNPRITVHSRNV